MKKALFAICLGFAACGFAADFTWTNTPATLSSPGVAASDPQIATASSGDAVAVWLEDGVVVSRSLPYRGVWSDPLDVLSQSGASAPQIVMDLNGNATAIWEEGGEIKSQSKPQGSSWKGNSEVLSGAGASQPALAVDPSGNIVAVWQEGGAIFSATQLFGGAWGTPEKISDVNASFPNVAIGANGQVVAVWQQAVSSVNTIFSAFKTINGTWATPASISTTGVNAVYPSVAVDQNGNALSAWFTYIGSGSNFSRVRVQTASLPFGGAWTSPLYFVWSGERDPAELVLKAMFSANGDGLLFWTNSAYAGTLSIFNTMLPQNSDTWVSLGSCVLQNRLAVDFDVSITGNNGLIAWMQYDENSGELALFSGVRYMGSPNTGWTPPSLVVEEGSSGFPVVSFEQVGNYFYGIAMWLNNNGRNNQIQANTGAQSILFPPTDLQATPQVQNFGVFQENQNLITWEASPSVGIIGYYLYRNGQLIAGLVGNTLQYIDLNQNPGMNSTYTIYAVDSTGGLSAPVSIVGP